jgi:uracil-DNA glycosylase
MLSINNILKDVKESWIPLLDNDRLELILTKLNKFKTDKQKILPTKNKIFQAFKYFELNETKVIWIGIDPYISCHQATGLSFSVPKDCKIPPSLKNIYTELKLYDKSHGNLTNWVINNQFLMLNSSLTVLEGKSNTHKKIWKEYTDKLIKDISDKTTKIIFLLFGKEAQSKVKYIDTTKHIIINSVHPSPLSAYNGFFNRKIFDKLDNYYEKIFKKKIDWNIN